MFLVIVQKQQT